MLIGYYNNTCGFANTDLKIIKMLKKVFMTIFKDHCFVSWTFEGPVDTLHIALGCTYIVLHIVHFFSKSPPKC